MQLTFVRGPQKNETKKFEVVPTNPLITIGETFSRDSTFYKDNKGVWQEKECRVELIVFGLDKKQSTAGHVTIDLGSLVGKEYQELHLPLKG